MLSLFFSLRDKGPALSAVLSRLIFPSVVRTLSSVADKPFLHPITGAFVTSVLGLFSFVLLLHLHWLLLACLSIIASGAPVLHTPPAGSLD